VKEQNYLK
jgi:hypothetical protein